MAGIFPDSSDYDQYWRGQQRRAKARANSAISPIFMAARDRITTDMLSVLNNRRYLKINNPRKRLVAVRRDSKIKQVEQIIRDANQKSLQAIFDNLGPHYEEEVPMICKTLYPWTEQIGACTANLSEREEVALRQEPYLGRTYREWIAINTQNAVKQWNSQFRAVMTGEIRTDKQASRDTQLVAAARGLLNTNESHNKTIFNNGMIQVSRQAQFDVEAAIWP
jgi:hypothetical protein